jgi:hypothetical protein
MNLVGKILIFLIFAMCLVFMAASLFLFAAHKNWKEHADGLQKKLAVSEQEKKAADDARKEKERQKKDLEALYTGTETALRTQVKTEAERNAKLTSDKSKVDLEHNAALERIQESLATIKHLESQITLVNADIERVKQERDKSVGIAVERTDGYVSLKAKYERLQSYHKELLAQLQELKAVLEWVGVKGSLEAVKGKPPADLHARVTATQGRYLQIDAGSDDGLRGGHELEVSKGNKYRGRVKIISVKPHSAVCERVAGESSPIQVGDDVTSDLKKR